MALIDQLDGIVFSAFQQNFLSNYADQVSPGSVYSLAPDVDPPFEPTDTSVSQGRGSVQYPRPSDSVNSPTHVSDRERAATISSILPNINSPSNRAEAEKSIHQLPFQDSINTPSSVAVGEKVRLNYPTPPGPPPQNLGTFTSPWPPQNNPTKLSQVPKNLPLREGTTYDGSKTTLGKDLYDGSNLSLVQGGPFSIPGLPAALRPADAFATAHWLRNIGKELFGNVDFQNGITNALVSTGVSKGFQFVSSQVLLASLNPTDPELGFGLPGTGLLNAAWNPASLVASAVPGARPTDFTSILAGPVVGAKFDPTTSRIDKYIAEIHKQTKVLAGGANAGILGGSQPEDLLSPGIPSRFPTFGTKSFSGFERIRDAVSVLPAVRPKDTPENVNARISDLDIDGVVDSSDEPSDDQIYVPLSFQDLRDGEGSTAKLLYFRAFIKPDSVTETFTPSWNETKYYGRVDNIPIYMGTSRVIGFSFDVVAFQPADLPVIYRKLHKLESMVYPFYDNQGFLSAGPIIRMRMGDLFSSLTLNGKRGLPGYLTSLDISYDNIWNIEVDFKVPRKATISISFTVLHERNPGTYLVSPNGKQFPTFGIGVEDPQNPGNFQGDEVGIRGLLQNIKSVREQRAKPATAGSTNTTPGK